MRFSHLHLFIYYINSGPILPSVIQGSNANSHVLLSSTSSCSFTKISHFNYHKLFFIPESFHAETSPHQPELCILTYLSLHFFGFHCGLCRICVHAFLAPQVKSFSKGMVRHQRLPSTHRSPEISVHSLKLGHIWRSFSNSLIVKSFFQRMATQNLNH